MKKAFNFSVLKYRVQFTILSTCIFLVGCSSETENNVVETELLNDIFIELVGTEYYYEELPLPPMPLEYAQNKQDTLDYKIKKETFNEAYDKPKLDSRELILEIDPYYLNPKREFRDWDINSEWFPRMTYPDTLHSKDFDLLLTELVDTTIFIKGKIDLSSLSKTGRYIIKDFEGFEQYKKTHSGSTYKSIATIRFSDFKINAGEDKAVFYLYFLCGPLCGSGEIIFCSKESEKWKIVYRNLVWIA